MAVLTPSNSACSGAALVESSEGVFLGFLGVHSEKGAIGMQVGLHVASSCSLLYKAEMV